MTREALEERLKLPYRELGFLFTDLTSKGSWFDFKSSTFNSGAKQNEWKGVQSVSLRSFLAKMDDEKRLVQRVGTHQRRPNVDVQAHEPTASIDHSQRTHTRKELWAILCNSCHSLFPSDHLTKGQYTGQFTTSYYAFIIASHTFMSERFPRKDNNLQDRSDLRNSEKRQYTVIYNFL